ncbi:MAG: hypothetical protein ACYTG2_11655 [Planctomycetota bacterium]|jgi:hypothetical protein
MIPFRTGNLGVEQLAAAREGRPAPDPEDERRLLSAWRAAGFDAVEDYVFWELVEPARGRFDWSVQRGNAAAARAAGLAYWIYPWAHAAPEWFRKSRDFVPGRCLEHGEPGPMMSPFAASTRDATLRFLHAARSGLGDLVDGIAVAFPADYGEAGFLSGVAGWLLGEGSHHHTGLWCAEREAQLAFSAQVRDRHGTPGRLGRAWRMDPQRAWERCPYPHDSGHGNALDEQPTLAHRLDFARFYQGAITDLTRGLLEEARELYPDVPRELKLGHCSETLELGTDWHALVGVAAATGATVRFTGAGMGEVFTRRLASLCRGHDVPFATEAPREVDTRHLVERLFTDLAAGTTSFFEFPEQMEAVREPLLALQPALGRHPLLPAVAIAYPTTELRLAPGHGAPTDTVHCWEAFRRVCDLHPLDERQIARGSLREHSALVWLESGHVPVETLAALDAWVRAGGVLITGGGRAPVPLPDDHGEMPAPDALLAAMQPARVRYRVLTGAPGAALHPGDEGARLLLDGGWHGRDEGAWAWPSPGQEVAPSLPCRWTGACATIHLPRPAAAGDAALELVLDAWMPPDDGVRALRVSLDGQAAGALSLQASTQARLALPPTSVDGDGIARITLELTARRPLGTGRDADRRELGLLVRRVALVPRGAVPREAHLFGVHSPPDILAEGERRILGAGCVLPGDGTPLSALAHLRSWLEQAPAEPEAAPRLARDVTMQCIVSALDGGLLVRNPHPDDAALPALEGHPAATAVAEPVPPLSTRWFA